MASTDWKSQYENEKQQHLELQEKYNKMEQDYEEEIAQLTEQHKLAIEELENEALNFEEKAIDLELKYEKEKAEKIEIISKSREKHEQSAQLVNKLEVKFFVTTHENPY